MHEWNDLEAFPERYSSSGTTEHAKRVPSDRCSKIVFIGYDLDRKMIEKGLHDALVPTPASN